MKQTVIKYTSDMAREAMSQMLNSYLLAEKSKPDYGTRDMYGVIVMYSGLHPTTDGYASDMAMLQDFDVAFGFRIAQLNPAQETLPLAELELSAHDCFKTMTIYFRYYMEHMKLAEIKSFLEYLGVDEGLMTNNADIWREWFSCLEIARTERMESQQ